MSPLDLLKSVGAPGTSRFMLVALSLLLTWLYIRPDHQRLVRAGFIGLISSYAILAVPVTAHWIAAALPTVDAVAPRVGDTLVVLEGDNAKGRAREAARLYESLDRPSLQLVGHYPMVFELVTRGIPRRAIQVTEDGLNTRAQLQQLSNAANAGRLLVLASVFHAPRIAALVDDMAIDAILVGTPPDEEPAEKGIWAFVPSRAASRVSADALYEHAALAYYRWRGWI